MSPFDWGDKNGDGCAPRVRSPFQPPDPETQARMRALEEEIADLARQQAACVAEVRELLRREMAGEGLFAKRINELKQRKMMLATEAQHRKVRLNALLLGL